MKLFCKKRFIASAKFSNGFGLMFKKKLKDKEIDEFLFNHPNMKRNLKEIGEL